MGPSSRRQPWLLPLLALTLQASMYPMDHLCPIHADWKGYITCHSTVPPCTQSHPTSLLPVVPSCPHLSAPLHRPHPWSGKCCLTCYLVKSTSTFRSQFTARLLSEASRISPRARAPSSVPHQHLPPQSVTAASPAGGDADWTQPHFSSSLRAQHLLS